MIEAFAYVLISVQKEIEARKVRFNSKQEHCRRCMNVSHQQEFGCCCVHVSEAMGIEGVKSIAVSAA